MRNGLPDSGARFTFIGSGAQASSVDGGMVLEGRREGGFRGSIVPLLVRAGVGLASTVAGPTQGRREPPVTDVFGSVGGALAHVGQCRTRGTGRLAPPDL